MINRKLMAKATVKPPMSELAIMGFGFRNNKDGDRRGEPRGQKPRQ